MIQCRYSPRCINLFKVFFVKGITLPSVFGKQGFGENGDVDLIVPKVFHQRFGEKTHAVQFSDAAF